MLKWIITVGLILLFLVALMTFPDRTIKVTGKIINWSIEGIKLFINEIIPLGKDVIEEVANNETKDE